jgi:hypothetical protein
MIPEPVTNATASTNIIRIVRISPAYNRNLHGHHSIGNSKRKRPRIGTFSL